jgi:hypothetical protein
MNNPLLKVFFFGDIEDEGLDFQMNQTGKLEDGEQHLFGLVFIDGLGDFQ